MDDYRFRAQHSPRNEAPMNSLVSPPRNGNRMPQPDPRTSLPRRFTTDSGHVPTLSSLTIQRPPEPQAYPTASEYKAQLAQKRRLEYERLKEQKQLFELEMQKLEAQQRQDEAELRQVELGRSNGLGLTGHLSEPTTPPEYRETSSGFPTMFSRPNRYSLSSLASPPGILNRAGRSGSQLASPQSGIPQSQSHAFFDDHLPSRSVPGTRRNSDEDEKEEALRQDPTSHRSTNALNRYSMPVTRRGNTLYDNIDQTNAAGFLFRDDESTMDSNYGGTDTAGDEGFPKLIAQKDNPNRLSASSVAVDLTSLGAANSEASNGWNKMTSVHRAQQSLSALDPVQMAPADPMTSSQSSFADAGTMGARSYRNSLDFKQHGLELGQYAKDATVEGAVKSPSAPQGLANPPKLQTSLSTNNIPIAKGPGVTTLNSNAHAQQHFHNHNASIGRIPPGAMPKRHSRELSSDAHSSGIPSSATFPSIGSALHANAPAFGPGNNAASQGPAQTSPSVSSPSSSSMSGYPSYYGNPGYNPTSPNGTPYNMGMLMSGMGNMNMNGYGGQNFTPYGPGPVYQPNQPRDSQQRVIQQRRAQDNEVMNRLSGLPLEQHLGNIFALCKDQHGCRYLQKQLETRDATQIHMIWVETNDHVVELMMDPFGNYLCQKLLEYCDDEERTILIRNAANHMVKIALNQHGTRALQKMIEFINLPEHVNMVIEALRHQVVPLIQDLNGNHVIQKCLNKLSSENNQFIFEAVGKHCIEVGTHRHGCCVLQRCIDHATGAQKQWLIQQITENATRLVTDPFGNYVVQYIIDLNDDSFTAPLVTKFQGGVGRFSRHKFSSNVIEKCLRCAPPEARDMMVQELLLPGEMERLLRDSYGNYVVQTALEHSSPQTKHQIVEAIRPVIHQVKTTPYGRRLSAKITAYDQNRGGSGNSSGQSTPSDPTQGQISLRSHGGGRGLHTNGTPMMGPMGYGNGIGGGRGHSAYPSSNNVTLPPPPRMAQSYTYPGGPAAQPGPGAGFF